MHHYVRESKIAAFMKLTISCGGAGETDITTVTSKELIGLRGGGKCFEGKGRGVRV